MILLRRVIGDALRSRRQSQHRTLREVSTAANVSLGYLSEIERGQKEASSELLAAVCDALGAQLSELLREVSQTVEVAEGTTVPPVRPTAPALAGAGRRSDPPRVAEPDGAGFPSAPSVGAQPERTDSLVSAAEANARVGALRAADLPSDGAKLPVPARIRLPKAALTTRDGRQLAVDGDVSVSVRQDSPLKATLRAKRNVRSAPERGRDTVPV
jgi:transcriptional regulator with XRE-family HTH domain